MAENTIGVAYLQIVPSMKGVTGEVSEALGNVGEQSGKSFGSKFSSALSGAGKVGVAAIGATAAATGALIGNIVSATSEVATYGDNIDKMSQKMGISAEAYQEWEAVMQHSGTSMETLKASMKTMANAVEGGNEAFQRLGISEEEVATLSQEDLFSKVITGLQDMGESSERTYLASQLLGRGATELGALLNTSAEDTEAMKQAVHDLGGVMSDEAVKQAAGFQDSLQDMQTAIQGLTRNTMSEFLPAITGIMDGISSVFTGDIDLGLEQITAGIDSFISSLTEKIPELLEVGMGIVTALAQAIIENLPALANAAIQVIGEIASFIIENLPMIIDVGLQILMSLADALIDNLPTIIPAIVDVVLTIVDKLTDPDTLVMLVEAALDLMIALAEGLIEALPKLIEKAPEIVINLVKAIIKAAPKILEAAVELIFKLVEGIVNLFGKLIEVGSNIVQSVKDGFMEKVEAAKNWGKDLIDNFINGIKEKWEHLKQTVSNVANTVKEFLGFSEPEKGPLANFHTFAPDMMELFAQGIRQNVGLVQSAIGDVASGIKSDFSVTSEAVSDVRYRQAPQIDSRSDVYGLLAEYLPRLRDGQTVEVKLVGDAAGLFRAVRNENKTYIQRTGMSAFV